MAEAHQQLIKRLVYHVMLCSTAMMPADGYLMSERLAAWDNSSLYCGIDRKKKKKKEDDIFDNKIQKDKNGLMDGIINMPF